MCSAGEWNFPLENSTFRDVRPTLMRISPTSFLLTKSDENPIMLNSTPETLNGHLKEGCGREVLLGYTNQARFRERDNTCTLWWRLCRALAASSHCFFPSSSRWSAQTIHRLRFACSRDHPLLASDSVHIPNEGAERRREFLPRCTRSINSRQSQKR